MPKNERINLWVSTSCRIANDLKAELHWNNRDVLHCYTGVAYRLLQHGMDEDEVRKSLLALWEATKKELQD